MLDLTVHHPGPDADAPIAPASSEKVAPISNRKTISDPERTPSGDASTKINKSERIRQFLAQHPDQANRHVVDALGQFGVTAGDVANFKTRERKRIEAGGATKGRGRPRKSELDDVPPVEKTATVAAPVSPVVEVTQPLLDADGITQMTAITQLVKMCGGIDNTKRFLDLLDEIESLRN